MGLFSRKKKYTEAEKLNMALSVVKSTIPYVDTFLWELDPGKLKFNHELAAFVLFSRMAAENAEDPQSALDALPSAIYQHLVTKSPNKEKDLKIIQDVLFSISLQMDSFMKGGKNLLIPMIQYIDRFFKLNLTQNDTNMLYSTCNIMIQALPIKAYIPYKLPENRFERPTYNLKSFIIQGAPRKLAVLQETDTYILLKDTTAPFTVYMLGSLVNDAGNTIYYNPTKEELQPLIEIAKNYFPQCFRA